MRMGNDQRCWAPESAGSGEPLGEKPSRMPLTTEGDDAPGGGMSGGGAGTVGGGGGAGPGRRTDVGLVGEDLGLGPTAGTAGSSTESIGQALDDANAPVRIRDGGG